MNRLDTKTRARVIAALIEGNSIRSTVRMTGVAKNTIVKLLADLGTACADFQNDALRGLPCKRVQCDEIWSFCYAKQKNVPENKAGEWGYGDVWTWTAICADTKLLVSYFVGRRDLDCARIFIQDLAGRLANRVQLTTDGHKPYLQAVEESFGAGIDYAMLVKMYGGAGSSMHPETRYSPGECTGCRKEVITGKPERRHVSTSYVERHNLTMRMSMRRFTRLTNAFSKKVENHEHSVALHSMYYNFARVHSSLRVTPAMEAGVTDHVWTIEEIVGLIS